MTRGEKTTKIMEEGKGEEKRRERGGGRGRGTAFFVDEALGVVDDVDVFHSLTDALHILGREDGGRRRNRKQEGKEEVKKKTRREAKPK